MTVSRETNLHIIAGTGGAGGGDGDLEGGLSRVAADLDSEIERSGAAQRVAAAVFSEIGMPRRHRLRWLAIAATLVLAAGLGGLVETARQQAASGVSVVALDPLTFGAVAVDQ